MITGFLSETLTYALIAEVSATPKPGLVDRKDNGAHKDMCHATFVASTHAIVPYLVQMAQTGLSWPDPSGDGLFAAIRPIGQQAEAAMFQATKGVNTHKGMIFSMGIISAAAGLFYRQNHGFCAEEILFLAGRLCRDALEQDFAAISREHPKTHGEQLFVRYGQRGIRGEAQQGFPSIRTCSLPAIRRFRASLTEENQIHVNTLLALMAQVDDTNVLIRTDHATLAYEKKEAARLLGLGGAATPQGLSALEEANRDFIRKNISPGGCADLLAATIFLDHMERACPGPYKSSL